MVLIMKVAYFGLQIDQFDYSSYEQKLRQITSIKLENITELKSSEQIFIENSFIKLAQAYFKQIETVLKESPEDV